MIINLIVWLTILALSFLVESIGIAKQGLVFLVLYMVLLIIVLPLLFYAIVKIVKPESYTFTWSITIILAPFVAFLASKFFNTDFFITFELITLGQCLISSQKKE